MKKLKLTNKGKKIIGVLATIASLLIILLIFILLSLTQDSSKSYNIVELQSLLPKEFEDLNLRDMDHIDLLSAFGLDKNEIPDSLSLMSYLTDEDGNNTSSENYIIVINSENYKYYYDILYSQIDSLLRYEEDESKVELYQNAIIKCGENYTYLIVSKDAKDIEKLINE